MPANPVLTFCTCIDPRKIDPATGHYPGCPDSIIPPSCLLPPWELLTKEERVYAGRSARSERHPDGKPIFDVVTRTELVPPRSAPVTAVTRPVPGAVASTRDPSATATDSTTATDSLDSTVCVLDTETTGTNDPRVCEIALAVVDLSSPSPKIIARHAKLLNPGKAIEPSAIRVHGIRDADVRDCPTLAEVWERLVAWVEKHAGSPGHPPQVIAHNAAFDRRAITGSLPLTPDELPPWHWRCSIALAKKVAPGLTSYSLHDDPSKGKVGLATSLKLVKGESHRAAGDATTTVSLLGALRARAGAWTAWRGEAVSWTGKAIAESVESPEGRVASAPLPAPVHPPAPPPPPASRKPARSVPSGPSLFDRLHEIAPEKRSAS